MRLILKNSINVPEVNQLEKVVQEMEKIWLTPEKKTDTLEERKSKWDSDTKKIQGLFKEVEILYDRIFDKWEDIDAEAFEAKKKPTANSQKIIATYNEWKILMSKVYNLRKKAQHYNKRSKMQLYK